MAFFWLEDGRRIAYQEMGCTQKEATRSLLVLHGAFSSRLFAMPGVSRAMLLDFGVRLVSIDRPGYGNSDPNPSQTLEVLHVTLQRVGAFCKKLVEKGHVANAFLRTLSSLDIEALSHPHILDFFLKDRLTSLGGWTNGFGLAKDFQPLTAPWGFEADELIHSYQHLIHIWQGDQDTAVPLLVQEVMERMLPMVRLHKLSGQGHFAGFYFNNCTHISTLNAIFGRKNDCKARL
ncbi:hypothetical protein L7F22_007320 [Adiantum nelumboides]|nr:hypothetical protein [Adiantum nelumboides]